MRERARDDVQHVHSKFEERYMVIFNPAEVELRPGAGDEEGGEFILRLDTILLIYERSAVREPLLCGSDLVEQPGGVDEGRANLRVRCAEKIQQNEMLYGPEFGFRGREEPALLVRLNVGGRPLLREVPATVNLGQMPEVKKLTSHRILNPWRSSP